MAQVTAIIPAFGHERLTRGAVAELRRQTVPPAEILVVDDGSEPPISPTEGARVLRHVTNRGFAAAVNTGVAEAQTDLVAVLNNDVSLAPDWLERLTVVVSTEQVDFACGKLYRPDGLIDGTFDLVCRGGLAWRVGAGRKDGPLWSQGRRIAFTSFTAMLGKREGVHLDESYHSYYEDVEWSLRAAVSNKVGYFEPLATGVHQGSATAGTWSEYSTRQILSNHRRLAFQYLLPEYGAQYRVARSLLRALSLRHGRWPQMQDEAIPAKPKSSQLPLVLQESEKLLYEMQMAGTPDKLWRWYFRLTGRAG
jgi:GT2 family glycosyltransferase